MVLPFLYHLMNTADYSLIMSSSYNGLFKIQFPSITQIHGVRLVVKVPQTTLLFIAVFYTVNIIKTFLEEQS